jgi:hypothetical protein
VKPLESVDLPFDPYDILIAGVMRGLEIAIGVFESLPAPIRLAIVIAVLVRAVPKRRKPKRVHSRRQTD